MLQSLELFGNLEIQCTSEELTHVQKEQAAFYTELWNKLNNKKDTVQKKKISLGCLSVRKIWRTNHTMQ